MEVSIHVSAFEFASQEKISLQSDSIVVFVGPNSSGKTQSLKDIWLYLSSPHKPRGFSVKDVSIEKAGTLEQYLAYIRANSIVRDNTILVSGQQLSPPDAFDKEWGKERPHHTGRLFAKLIGADDRLSAIKERKRIDRSKQKPEHPLQALDFEPDQEKLVSKSFYNIFGQHLMLDRGAGSVVNLHVGDQTDITLYGEVFSPTYSTEVRKMPDISEEGDGYKAAAGLFLNIFSIPKSVYLIDEPDVYLHPPQAYAAAKEIVNISARKQLFLATHNAHFVRGLLDTDSQRIVLIRLDRAGNTQSTNLIENSIFSEIESDPLIRFSNVLEAMFFRTVMVCESEADCLFYRNLCRAVDPAKSDDDVFWLSAHGKQNIRKLIRILRRLGLRVISIPDLDIINDETNLKSLFESHGGHWVDISTEFSTISRLMNERKPTTAVDDVKVKINQVLDRVPAARDGLFPDQAAQDIRKVLRSASPWRELKESGIKALGKGQNRIDANNLLKKLFDHGIVVPSVGEMESFYPFSGAHGMEWVNDVLGLDLVNEVNLAEARDFAGIILSARS